MAAPAPAADDDSQSPRHPRRQRPRLLFGHVPIIIIRIKDRGVTEVSLPELPAPPVPTSGDGQHSSWRTRCKVIGGLVGFVAAVFTIIQFVSWLHPTFTVDIPGTVSLPQPGSTDVSAQGSGEVAVPEIGGGSRDVLVTTVTAAQPTCDSGHPTFDRAFSPIADHFGAALGSVGGCSFQEQGNPDLLQRTLLPGDVPALLYRRRASCLLVLTDGYHHIAIYPDRTISRWDGDDVDPATIAERVPLAVYPDAPW